MARDKKPNKANKKKYADPKTGEFRHTDGDRRHRGAMSSAKDAVKQKRKLQEQGLPPDPADEADEWDESEMWDEPDETGETKGGADA
jgi:hypothetical protein